MVPPNLKKRSSPRKKPKKSSLEENSDAGGYGGNKVAINSTVREFDKVMSFDLRATTNKPDVVEMEDCTFETEQLERQEQEIVVTVKANKHQVLLTND